MLVEKIERKTKDQTQRGFEQLTVIPYITENQINFFFLKKNQSCYLMIQEWCDRNT
jgi:hypothetical protein